VFEVLARSRSGLVLVGADDVQLDKFARPMLDGSC